MPKREVCVPKRQVYVPKRQQLGLRGAETATFKKVPRTVQINYLSACMEVSRAHYSSDATLRASSSDQAKRLSYSGHA